MGICFWAFFLFFCGKVTPVPDSKAAEYIERLRYAGGGGECDSFRYKLSWLFIKSCVPTHHVG
jgi:hypothetical protein